MEAAVGRWEPVELMQTDRRSVLVVDDEALIRWSLAEALADEGLQVQEAATGAEALALMGAWHGDPPAVVLDLRLPDVEDLSLLREIRRRWPDWPVFVMTAFGTPETHTEVLALGARAFVQKPCDVTSVARLVARTWSDV